MSAPVPKTKRLSRAKTSAPPTLPGRIPDEVFDKFYAALAKLTPKTFRQHLVEYGITDKKGKFLHQSDCTPARAKG